MTDEDEVPAGWPPVEDVTSKVVPLFPLRNLFLFPGTVVPLHIFEPRYRQMIEDSLDGPGRLVIGTIVEEDEEGGTESTNGAPAVHSVAGLGEIARHERMPDGRFVIMLVGLTRVRVRETTSNRLYRQVEIEPLEEVPVPEAEVEGLRAELFEAVKARTPELQELPGEMPVGHLTDLLLLRMQLPQSAMQPLYCELVIADRARRALEEHHRRPIPVSEEGQAPDTLGLPGPPDATDSPSSGDADEPGSDA